jgi:hypothetical protein
MLSTWIEKKRKKELQRINYFIKKYDTKIIYSELFLFQFDFFHQNSF